MRAALALTDAVTLVSDGHVPREVWDAAAEQFDEEELAQLLFAIVVIPPGQPHGFVNSGEGRLRQVDIHVSPSFSTEWLEKGEP